ncbi:unnamed protein product [Didymodactylos carnosus]|uniref:BTB domain-containing protein n=1 Tax=Didymodactylos carnosus TaxID=1234261 RepID=A0A813RS31_9BILA|nr:unnamed protein product [Didymodactylos carnosus]CAF0977880.1 unnamed protein product [Didymodactylos carnosus]CAF3568455.1 unnamed protein product [Didymodactylos carnosus]CAF3748492.1 unnamed protein product [Didymodactylos carnosus]
MSDSSNIIELNIGGVTYSTLQSTLQSEPGSLLANLVGQQQNHHSNNVSTDIDNKITRDNKNRYFIDRDGVLFRYVLDYLRCKKLVLPESFQEKERLKNEAEYYKLTSMVKELVIHQQLEQTTNTTINSNENKKLAASFISLPDSPVNKQSRSVNGYIVVGYRGTFAFGRDGLADVKFRKISRILVCGRVNLCREVFGDTLNESRDPDHGQTERYTSRFFLKHTFLEQAFDMLGDAGFTMVGCAASGCSSSTEPGKQTDNEENRWLHYNEFAFQRGQ